jgi:non-ribosomal peptide synthetase component F
MTRSPRIVVAMLAVLKAGAAYVPILPTDPPERIQYIIRDTRSRILVSETGLCDVVRSIQPSMPRGATLLSGQSGLCHVHLRHVWSSEERYGRATQHHATRY